MNAPSIALTSWETESARSGVRDWAIYACSACHPISFADPARHTYQRPVRRAEAMRRADLHLERIHSITPAESEMIERPRP